LFSLSGIPFSATIVSAATLAMKETRSTNFLVIKPEEINLED
jgi:hypothetical protein